MFEEYISRADAMRHDNVLIFSFVVGALLIAATSLIVGILLLYFHAIRKHLSQKIYLPLGLFFVTFCLTKVFEVISVWHNYAIVISGLNIICGCMALWVALMLPLAIMQRRAIADCHDIRKEKMDLERKIDELKELQIR